MDGLAIAPSAKTTTFDLSKEASILSAGEWILRTVVNPSGHTFDSPFVIASETTDARFWDSVDKYFKMESICLHGFGGESNDRCQSLPRCATTEWSSLRTGLNLTRI